MTEQQEKYEVAVRDDVLIPTWERMKEQAKMLHGSGFFPKTIKKPEQALAVMLAGRELGLGPMESLRSIYIVDGQTCVSSGLMAAMIWGAGHGYEILESTEELCRIKFWRQAGITRTYYVHTFTIEDAAKANLLGKFAWKAYKKAMLFNRCISGGGRAFLPDVTRRMYTPEEMGAPVTVSAEGDVVIDAEATEITEDTPENPPQEKANGKRLPRPWPPEELKRAMLHNVTEKGWDEPASKEQIGLVAGKLDEIWAGDKGATANRHEFTGYIFGKRSAKELTKGEASVILDWLLDKADSTGDQPFKTHAREEANLVLRQAMLDQGQQEMPLDDETVAKDREDLIGRQVA